MMSIAFALALLLPHPHGAAEAPAPVQEAELPPSPIEPALTANTDEPSGVLRFSIRDKRGKAIPGRLTFVREPEGEPDLFPGIDARPDNLAVRYNVVYCLSGEDAITVPPGDYWVYATRGIEWGQAMTQLTIPEGGEVEWHAVLEHEVSSSGWISGDFHLHTLTYSGHGDSNLKERIISLIGEGVEFAVATDHNHNTDYHPTIADLEASEQIAAVTGNEISTPIGHFNAFPLDPGAAVIDASLTDARELFRLIRNEEGSAGVVPVIQLNHPRWEGIDYFTQTGLDPVTGRSEDPNYSSDFDTLEVLNENEGWGYHDADTTEIETGSGLHSVLRDWYNLLNLGHRYFAVGNSDSHTVHHAFAGYPRNYVQVPEDDPEEVKPVAVAAALRAGRCFTTTGPFIRFEVNGQESGDVVRTTSPRVLARVKLDAPSWVYLNRVKFVLNGDVVETVEVEPRVREDGSIAWPTAKAVVHVHRDSWLHVIVEGDESLQPIVTGRRPILPLAISNPIWIETDNDPAHSSTWDWAVGAVATCEELSTLPPSEAAMILHAAAFTKVENAPRLVRQGLGSPERLVQLAALRAIESLELRGLGPVLNAFLDAPPDLFFAIALCRAAKATGAPGGAERLLALQERYGSAQLRRYRHELEPLLEGEPVRAWSVAGPFGSGERTALFERSLEPGAEAEWQELEAGEAGYLDLSGQRPAPAEEGAAAPPSVAFARTWIQSPDAREVLYALGTDDGCRLWLGEEELHRDEGEHGASPLQHLGQLSLQAGWNRVLIGVQNVGGPTGLYFRIFDEELTASATRP